MTPLLLELMATFVLSQGLGLFAARDIEKQTMVIEYNGTILRNEVALRKEKTYRSQVPPVALRTSFFRCVELIFKEAKLNCSLSDRTEPCSCSVSTASTLLTRAGMAGWQGNNESLFMVWHWTKEMLHFSTIQKYSIVKCSKADYIWLFILLTSIIFTMITMNFLFFFLRFFSCEQYLTFSILARTKFLHFIRRNPSPCGNILLHFLRSARLQTCSHTLCALMLWWVKRFFFVLQIHQPLLRPKLCRRGGHIWTGLQNHHQLCAENWKGRGGEHLVVRGKGC